MQTAGYPRLSCSHAAAATDALCGFLRLGCISSHRSLNQLCLDLRTWKDVFDVFLRSPPSRKAKPTRQFLLTLMYLRTRSPNPQVKIDQIDYACSKAAQIICGADQTTSVKCAFQTLEYVLSNGLINTLGIITLVAQISKRQAGLCLQGIPSTTSDQHDIFVESDAVGSASEGLMQSFIYDVLNWLHYPDTAAAAGRLLSILIKSSRSSLPENTGTAASALSICMKSLISLLNDQPHTRNAIKNSILPDLLRLNSAEAMAWLEPMRPLHLSYNNNSQMYDAEIEICLLAAEVAEDLGFFPGTGMHSNLNNNRPIAMAESLPDRVRKSSGSRFDRGLRNRYADALLGQHQDPRFVSLESFKIPERTTI